MAEEVSSPRSRRGEFGRQMETRDPEALKKFYEMADVAPENPGKELREASKYIESSRKEKKAAESSGGTGFSGGFDETSATPEAGEAIVTSQNRNLVPKTPLGKDAHRRIYGVHEALRLHGDNADESHVEEHGRIWDQMPADSQALWQRGPGAKSTAAAVRNISSIQKLTKSGTDTRRERNRYKATAAVLGTGDLEGGSGAITRQVSKADADALVDKFKSTGIVQDEDGNPQRDWKKGWVAHITSDSSIRKQSGQTAVGTALHADPQHHEALGNHIDELSSRASKDSSGANLQNSQFSGLAEKHANAAREALTASARAHSIGLKDMAVSKFNESINHAGDLAETVNAGNSAATDKDFDAQETIKANYKTSVNPKSAFGR